MLPDEYYTYYNEFLIMLTQFESLWPEHVPFTKVVRHRIDLEMTDNRPI